MMESTQSISRQPCWFPTISISYGYCTSDMVEVPCDSVPVAHDYAAGTHHLRETVSHNSLLSFFVQKHWDHFNVTKVDIDIGQYSYNKMINMN